MKIAIALSTILFSTLSFAHVTECTQTEKLKCTVEYTIRTGDQVITQKAVSSAGYELVNSDEPSLSYCEASVGFNQNNIYVIGSMSSGKQISVSIRHMGADVNATSSKGATVQASASYSPSIEVSENGVSGTLQAATARCNVSR